jgi:hypothetical protein
VEITAFQAFSIGNHKIFFSCDDFGPVGTPLNTECRAFSGKMRGKRFESALGTKMQPLRK